MLDAAKRSANPASYVVSWVLTDLVSSGNTGILLSFPTLQGGCLKSELTTDPFPLTSSLARTRLDTEMVEGD